MKKTIWQPLVIGVALGLLAGITMVSGLSFLLSSTEASNAIGFYMTLFLLSAAIGGPLAGAITSTICVTFVAMFGAPEMKEFLSDPINLWSNMFVTGMLVALIGFEYRMIFERVKLPARLLPWAGIVIAYYIISGPINLSIQFHLHGEVGVLPAILRSYQDWRGQESRADDAREAVARRLKAYREQTAPVLAWYEDHGGVHRLPGTGSIDEFAARIRDALGR